MTGDPLSKVWIPYFGMRGKGRCCDILNYKWRVVGSPFGFNKFTDPILFHCQSATQTEIHESRFTLEAQDGRYIQGDFEALFNVNQTLAFNAWVTGSWMRFTGEGKSELNVIGSTVISNTGTPALQPGNEIINHATLTDSWYGAGLSVDLRF
ncbi:MAG: hypothetical protein HY913_01380 [Desulfomonile tiedjei]|nr:hypothetical protein [Desulfomonile tiedjei]